MAALYKVFFPDIDDFWQTAKENTFWFALSLLFDTTFGGVKFILWLLIGVIAGVLAGSTLYGSL